MDQMRLQVFLAKAGIASRRHAEKLIVDGQVSVNGKVVTELGTQVSTEKDRVTLQGKRIIIEPVSYILLNKPKGYVTSSNDPEGRDTVFSLLENPYENKAEPSSKGKSKVVKAPKVRLFAVGRLDYNTEGAILLTNDGVLAHRLMHPRFGVEKIYHAKLKGHLSKEQVQSLRQGVLLAPSSKVRSYQKADSSRKNLPRPRPEKSAPAEVTVLATTSMHTWLEIIIHEGKNRQIHRMAEAISSTVLKLARVQYAFLSVLDMEVGSFRKLQPDEVENLYQLTGMDRSLAHEKETSVPSKKRTTKNKKPLSS